MSFPFGIGTTLVHFHILGNVQLLIQMLNSFITDEAIEQAVAFSMWAEVLAIWSTTSFGNIKRTQKLHSTSHKSQQGTDWSLH